MFSLITTSSANTHSHHDGNEIFSIYFFSKFFSPSTLSCLETIMGSTAHPSLFGRSSWASSLIGVCVCQINRYEVISAVRFIELDPILKIFFSYYTPDTHTHTHTHHSNPSFVSSSPNTSLFTHIMRHLFLIWPCHFLAMCRLSRLFFYFFFFLRFKASRSIPRTVS